MCLLVVRVFGDDAPLLRRGADLVELELLLLLIVRSSSRVVGARRRRARLPGRLLGLRVRRVVVGGSLMAVCSMSVGLDVGDPKRRGGLQGTVGDRRRDVRGPGLAPARLRRVELRRRLLVREEALELLRLWELTSESRRWRET